MIASQIEPLPQELRGPETFQGLWKGKKGKKDVSGLFSKILSGLLKNPGNRVSLAAEDGERGGSDLKPGGMPGEAAGESPGGTPPVKKSGRAFKAGSGFSAVPEEKAGKKEEPAGRRKEAGDVPLYGGVEIPLRKLRVSPDPGEDSPAPEGAESGLWGEGALSQDPELSPVQGAYLSGGPEFPVSEEIPAGEGPKHRFPRGEEALSGFEPAEVSRAGEAKPGPRAVEKTGKDEKRPAEARRTERRRERPAVFETLDLRSGQEAGASGLKEEALPEGEALSGREIDLSVELKSESRGSERASLGGEKTLSQAFEDILARELHQNLNGDIVRHASVILRDGGEGLIRLSLKPDVLGNVKIRLEMAENKITGHIVVESDEALRAFEREIGALEQAFKDSGFEDADLNMSLDPGADRQREGGEAFPFFSERFAVEQAASRYDALTEKTDMLFAIGSANGLKPGNGRISVNLLV